MESGTFGSAVKNRNLPINGGLRFFCLEKFQHFTDIQISNPSKELYCKDTNTMPQTTKIFI